MNFTIPKDVADFLADMDAFIERELRPLERADDNIRFFDHRREDARTDWHRGGLPNEEWEALLRKVRTMADAAGFYRYPLPRQYGGRDGTNLGMAIIREDLAAKGLGLHCDLQTEHSIVSNHVGLLLMLEYGTETQKERFLAGLLDGSLGFAFGITEPEHGSDATHMETRARRDGNGWRIGGEKTWNTGVHTAPYDLIFARTRGHAGDGDGITAFLVPTDASGFKIEEYLWTFNMPTDHARISLTDVRVPDEAVFGGEGRGLQFVQHFFNENRIRQAASSLGAAQYCIDEAVAYNLPPPWPLPHPGGDGGDPDAAHRGVHVRLHEAARAEGRHQRLSVRQRHQGFDAETARAGSEPVLAQLLDCDDGLVRPWGSPPRSSRRLPCNRAPPPCVSRRTPARRWRASSHDWSCSPPYIPRASRRPRWRSPRFPWRKPQHRPRRGVRSGRRHSGPGRRSRQSMRRMPARKALCSRISWLLLLWVVQHRSTTSVQRAHITSAAALPRSAPACCARHWAAGLRPPAPGCRSPRERSAPPTPRSPARSPSCYDFSF